MPVTFALAGRRLVTAVDHKPKTTTRLRRLENIRRHPEVTLLADHYEEDWARLWWVRLRATARVVDAADGADHADAVAALVAKYGQYEDTPPAGPVIVADVTDVRFWSGYRAARG